MNMHQGKMDMKRFVRELALCVAEGLISEDELSKNEKKALWMYNAVMKLSRNDVQIKRSEKNYLN